MLYYVILFIAVFCGSLSYIFVRWSTAPSMVLVVYRMAMAAVLLAPAAIRGREAYRRITKKQFFTALAAGATLGAHFSLYFQSLRMTQVGVAAVLVNMQVLFVAIFSLLFLHEKISLMCWILLFIALGGAAVVTSAGGLGGGGSLIGNLCALGGGAALGGYTVFSRKCREFLPTTQYTFITYSTAAVTVLAVLMITRTPLTGYGTVNYGAAAALVIFCTFLGHSLFSFCLKRIRPSVVAAMQLLDTVYGALFGVIFFQEHMSARTLAGAGVLMVSVIAFTLLMDREDPKLQKGDAYGRET